MDEKIKREIADKIWDSLKVEEYGLDDNTAKHAIRMAIDAAVLEYEKWCVWHYVDDPESERLANAKLIGDCGRTEDWLDFTSRYATPKRCDKCGRPVAIQIDEIVLTQPW